MVDASARAGTDADEAVSALIRLVGRRVRRARDETGLSRRGLSERSGVSLRYLAQLEGGAGNISIGLLLRVAQALGVPVGSLLAGDDPAAEEAASMAAQFAAADAGARARVLQVLDPKRLRALKADRICLIGLRGAGKSTLGRLVGDDLGIRFAELNGIVEDMAGMPVGEVIALYGQEGYRELEGEALAEIVRREDRLILAVGGGIVSERSVFGTLLSRFHTIWLRASPGDHMDRVRAQGDLRPMAGNPQALVQLRQILKGREAGYRQAEHALDTSGKAVEVSRAELRTLIARIGLGRAGQEEER